MSEDELLWLGILALGCAWEILCLVLAARNERRHRLVVDLPTSKTTGVFIGLVEVCGTAESPTPLTSPLSGTPCVWHRWTVSEEWERQETEHYTDSDGKSQTRTVTKSGWETVASGGEEVAFALRDDRGEVRVAPAGATVEPESVLETTCGRRDALYFAKGPAGELSHSTHRRRFAETAIPLHADLYVVGQARERDDLAAAEIARDPHAPMFVISTRGERAVASEYRWAGIGWALAGLVPFALWLWYDLDRDGAEDWRVPVMAAAGYLAAWGCAWLLMAYNSLIELRQRVRQAWANVDVQLKRRADLIPGLTRVVESYRGHERDVQEHLAALRSQLVITPPGQVGPDARSCVFTVRALAERYPALLADRSFTTLSATLTDCEDRIALARGYFNDIATFMNTRLEAIPDRFVAALAGLRAQPLMTADGFERIAPEVRLESAASSRA